MEGAPALAYIGTFGFAHFYKGKEGKILKSSCSRSSSSAAFRTLDSAQTCCRAIPPQRLEGTP